MVPRDNCLDWEGLLVHGKKSNIEKFEEMIRSEIEELYERASDIADHAWRFRLKHKNGKGDNYLEKHRGANIRSE